MGTGVAWGLSRAQSSTAPQGWSQVFRMGDARTQNEKETSSLEFYPSPCHPVTPDSERVLAQSSGCPLLPPVPHLHSKAVPCDSPSGCESSVMFLGTWHCREQAAYVHICVACVYPPTCRPLCG